MTDILEGERRIQVNGLTFRVIDQGRGPAVLLVHGWPDSVYVWRHQIPALLHAGYHIIALDLPGFGESDRPTEVDAYKVANILGYIKGILATLKVERVSIVGHDWALFREFLQGQGEVEHSIEDLSKPGALAATLNMYRANISPAAVGTVAQATPPVQCPTMGVWGSEDFAMSEGQMMHSSEFVKGTWRYERIEGAGHWLTTDASELVNTLLLDFLGNPL